MSLRTGHVAFATLCVLFIGANFAWILLDRSPPAWDDGYYLTRSLALYDTLTADGIGGYARGSLNIMAKKPPLIAMAPAPVYLLMGRHPRAALAVNLASLLVMFATLDRICRRYASRHAGLFAIAIAGTMPMVYGLARWYLVECGLTAMVCVAVCLLIERDEAWRGFPLGAAFGLGLLMKASFPAYVLPLLLFVVICERRSLLRLRTLLVFAAPLVMIAGPWYLFHYADALETARQAGSARAAAIYGTGPVLSLSAIETYLANLFNSGPAWYFAAAALLLPAVFRFTGADGRKGLLVSALWMSPLPFLVLGNYRDLRWAAPIFPAVAIALAILIDAALRRWGAAALAGACLLIALPLLSMVQSSFGWLGAAKFELGGLLFVAPRFDYARRYNPAVWPHRELLRDLYARESFTGAERRRVLLGTNTVRFNADNFALANLRERLPFLIDTTAYETDLQMLLGTVDTASYFVYKEGGEPETPNFNLLREAAIERVRGGGRFIELPIDRQLPDGGIAHVFANRGRSTIARRSFLTGHDLQTIQLF